MAIASRVSRPKPDAGVNLSEITLNEATIMQVGSTSLTACFGATIPSESYRAELTSELRADVSDRPSRRCATRSEGRSCRKEAVSFDGRGAERGAVYWC